MRRKAHCNEITCPRRGGQLCTGPEFDSRLFQLGDKMKKIIIYMAIFVGLILLAVLPFSSNVAALSYEVSEKEFKEIGFVYGWRVAHIYLGDAKKIKDAEKAQAFIEEGLKLEINFIRIIEERYFDNKKVMSPHVIHGIQHRIKRLKLPTFCDTPQKRVIYVARWVGLREYRLGLQQIKLIEDTNF